MRNDLQDVKQHIAMLEAEKDGRKLLNLTICLILCAFCWFIVARALWGFFS